MFALGACGSDGAEVVSVTDAWSREPADGQTTSAVYGEFSNDSDSDITIIGVTSPTAGVAELHETTMNDDGQMSMSEREGGFVIPAGDSFVFEPGGPHIMILNVNAASYPDPVEVTVEFDDGSTLAFDAEVRAISDEDEMDGEIEPASTDDG